MGASVIKFPQEPVFRVGDWDGPKPYFERDWWKRSVDLHRHDHGHRYYLPTPRTCPGVERESENLGDKAVIAGCVLLVVVLIIVEML
jgi:hypothetical protein